MLSVEDLITGLFCCVDNLEKEVTNGKPMPSIGFQPSLSDSEVIAMEIVAEFQGIDRDKGILQYFRRHWFSMFPQWNTPICAGLRPVTLWIICSKSRKIFRGC
jgi:hypothetical protein